MIPFRKSIKKVLVGLNFYPQSPNLIGRTPWNKTKMRDFFFASKSFSQQGEDLTLDRILLRKLNINLATYKGFYVDAGAYHPLSHSTTYLLYKRGWDGICIDISEKSCELIKKLRPRDVVVNAATSDFDGELYFEQQPVVSLTNSVSTVPAPDTTATVDAFTLNSILKQHKVDRQIDYLNIDTEGAELQTLRGLDFEKYVPRVISVEIHAASVEAALKTELVGYLYSKGYQCVACNVITFFFIKADDRS